MSWGLYAGAVTLLLALVCVFGRTAPKRLRPLAAHGDGGRGRSDCSTRLGEFGPLHWLTAWLPLVNRLRFPCRAILFMHLSLATLAAIGWAGLNRTLYTSPRPHAALAAIWLVVAASVFFAIAGPIWWEPYVSPAPLVWLGPAILAVGALAADAGHAGRSRRAIWSHSIGGRGFGRLRHELRRLSVGDAADSIPQSNGHAAGAVHSGVIVDPPQTDPPGLRSGDRLLLSGWRLADGYAGLEPARQLEYRTAAAQRVAGVGWVAQGDNNHRTWLATRNPLPRARLVSEAVASDDPARDIDHVHLDSAALVEPGAVAELNLNAGPAGAVAIIADRPGSIYLRPTAIRRQLLVISESFHPGWRATVDGVERPVLRVNGDFLGCVVGPGTSDVRFDFRPASLQSGRALTAGGLSLWVAMLAIGIFYHEGTKDTKKKKRT